LYNEPGINFQLNASQERLDSSHYWEKKFIDPIETLISRSFFILKMTMEILSAVRIALEKRAMDDSWIGFNYL
jgi:hypothetical protein